MTRGSPRTHPPTHAVVIKIVIKLFIKIPIQIVDIIMVPLGIVFVLEVDDWIVTPYLMIDVESDESEHGDVDDNYQDMPCGSSF